MTNRIMVTGGAGYNESIMVQRFLDAGHHVTVLYNFLSGGAELAHCCANERFQAIRGDARDVPK